MKTKQLLILVLAVLLVIVIIQNTGVAVVQLLFWKISMSMIILIVLVALIGFIIGYLTGHHRLDRERD